MSSHVQTFAEEVLFMVSSEQRSKTACGCFGIVGSGSSIPIYCATYIAECADAALSSRHRQTAYASKSFLVSASKFNRSSPLIEKKLKAKVYIIFVFIAFHLSIVQR